MNETSLETYGGIVVPVSTLRQEQRRTKYGTLADLPDEELANPDELERLMYKEMWWPILRLPQQRWECPIRANIDEDGRVDWGAFGTVDFDRYRPKSSNAASKIAELKERFKDKMITCEMIGERIPGHAKYEILELVSGGILDPDDISNGDMWQLAVNHRQALWLQRRMRELQEWSQQRREQRTKVFWRSMGC